MGALGILLLVALFAALAPLSLRTDSATYAQTETTAPLPAPTLTAEAKGANAVELNWTAVAGAARYQLWVWTATASHQQLDDVFAPATTFTHSELSAGTTYYYWVRAVSAAGEEGALSDPKDATVGAAQSSTATPTSVAPAPRPQKGPRWSRSTTQPAAPTGRTTTTG